MRIHWMVYLWLLVLSLLCLTALVLPVSLGATYRLNTYFLTTLALAGLAISPWVYIQARFAPQLRQISQPRAAVYLLAGYFLIFGLYLELPYAFVDIIEARISNKISDSALSKDDLFTLEINNAHFALRQPEEVIYKLQQLLEKYKQEEALRKINWSTPGGIFEASLRIRFSIGQIAAIKKLPHHLVLRGEAPTDFILTDARIYRDQARLVMTTLTLVLLLRIFQTTTAKSFLATTTSGFAASYFLFLTLGDPYPIMGIGLIIFMLGGFTTFYSLRLKQGSIFLVMGVNSFLLLLAWSPAFLFALFYVTDLPWK